MRNKPEEFLSTNKRDASKVLAKQVYLYHKEEETRFLSIKGRYTEEPLLKTTNNLFNNSHVTLFTLLDQQREILVQPV